MTTSRPDPLLNIARAVVGAFMGIFCFAALMVTIGLGAILSVQRQTLLAKLAAEGIPPQGYWAIGGILLLVLTVLILGFFFMRQLFAIVGSVRNGDPFLAINADRLRTMGWLSLAAQPVMWGISAIALWVHQYTNEVGTAGDGHFSISGLLLTLVLFILARVFRTGTQMRDDLEGTV